MDPRLKYLILASLMATLTAIGAQIRIPMIPVPFTLQTMFVLLAGSILGPKWGAGSMLIYLALGIMGLPVFAGTFGPGVIVGPTFGYLLGFPLAAFWAGKRIVSIDQKGSSILRLSAIFLESQVWIFVLGVSYLWLISNYYLGDRLPPKEAALVGFVFFIPSAIVKALGASWITIHLKKGNWI